MKKKGVRILIIVCILEAILLIGFIGYHVYLHLPIKAFSAKANAPEPGYFPEEGYVSTPEAAEGIGVAVIDQITGHFSLQKAHVGYDKDQQIWIVSRSYWPSSATGAEVYIDRQTGQIVEFVFYR